MKRTFPLLATLLISASTLTFPTFSQAMDNTAAMERMERIERDFMLLQRQVARGGPTTVNTDDLPAEGAAQLEVRLSSIEEELRLLNGKVEENEFQVKKLVETFEKFQKDTEFRLNEMAPGAASADGVQPAPGTKPDPAQQTLQKRDPAHVKTIEEGKTVETPTAATGESAPKDLTTAGDGVLRVPEKEDPESFSTPRDLYNYAFRLLNDTRYEDAAASFAAFTKKYPKDPLIGNAYYWQGESYYIRRDFVSAADNFRQGFEVLPTGPKAPDNLLKLAMSLDALKRDKEACVVLQQIIIKFKKSTASVANKAELEKKRIGCN